MSENRLSSSSSVTSQSLASGGLSTVPENAIPKTPNAKGTLSRVGLFTALASCQAYHRQQNKLMTPQLEESRGSGRKQDKISWCLSFWGFQKFLSVQ